MKYIIFKFAVIVFAFSIMSQNRIYGQTDCKVLADSISGNYKGDCKKGLAEGQGTASGTDTYTGEFKKGLPNGNGKYTWANGNIFDGSFKNGLMDGKGSLTMVLPDGNKKVQTGYWQKGKYIGEFESPYVVTSKSAGVLSVRISPTDNPAGDGDALFIQISHKGKAQQSPDFSLNVTTGSFMSQYLMGLNTKVIVSTFPFGFSLNYMGESVEIKIYQRGSWNIRLDYNKQ